jgi:DNA-binding NtrC family response regulator
VDKIKKNIKIKNILVVDDDSSITSIFDYVLKQQGFSIQAFSDVESFTKYVKKNPKIDIAFIDLKLKDVSGLHLLKALTEYNKEILTIMMTGFTSEKLIKKIYDLGAYGMLYKPFDLDDVIAIINSVEQL